MKKVLLSFALIVTMSLSMISLSVERNHPVKQQTEMFVHATDFP